MWFYELIYLLFSVHVLLIGNFLQMLNKVTGSFQNHSLVWESKNYMHRNFFMHAWWLSCKQNLYFFCLCLVWLEYLVVSLMRYYTNNFKNTPSASFSDLSYGKYGLSFFSWRQMCGLLLRFWNLFSSDDSFFIFPIA